MALISERISRRALLRSGGVAGLALMLPGVAQARATRRHRRHLSHLRRSSYEPLVGQDFRVFGRPYHLRLVAVKDLNPAQAGSENAFALVFRARPGAAPLSKSVPWLGHPRLSTFRLLLSPGMPSASGQPYAAVINRLPA
jgi:hypothetical protein